MKGRNPKVKLALTIVLLSSFSGAQTLTGTVKNGTTGKPAAGDEIVLLKLGQGIEEVGHTRTDSKLKEELFRLEVEHKHGDISQQEYDSVKAALDQTLERALKRETAKQV